MHGKGSRTLQTSAAAGLSRTCTVWTTFMTVWTTSRPPFSESSLVEQSSTTPTFNTWKHPSASRKTVGFFTDLPRPRKGVQPLKPPVCSAMRLGPRPRKVLTDMHQCFQEREHASGPITSEGTQVCRPRLIALLTTQKGLLQLHSILIGWRLPHWLLCPTPKQLVDTSLASRSFGS